jgi:hypothetical protein
MVSMAMGVEARGIGASGAVGTGVDKRSQGSFVGMGLCVRICERRQVVVPISIVRHVALVGNVCARKSVRLVCVVTVGSTARLRRVVRRSWSR